MILDDNFADTTLNSNKDRPSTMQVGRNTARKSHGLVLDSKLEEV